MPATRHDHRDHIYTVFSRIPAALAGFFGARAPSALYLWNFLFLGLPLWIVFNYGFLTTFPIGGPNDILYATIYLAGLWIWIGPLLICWWEQRYVDFLAELCARAEVCVTDTPETKRIIGHYRRNAKLWALFIGLCTIALGAYYIPQIPPLAPLYDRPLIIALSLIVALLAGAMSGYGIAGALQTIVLYRNLDRLNLRWDPLRGDEAGGFVFLGDFATKTTVAFAVGTITLPALMQLNRHVSNSVALGASYFLAAFYSILIIATAAVPLYFAVQAARRDRELCLGSLGERLRCIIDFRVPGGFESIRQDQPQIAWVDMLLNADSKVRAASILPFSPTSVAKVVVLALLPFVSTAVRYIMQIL